MDYCTEIDDDSIDLHSWSIVKSRIKTLYNLFRFVEMRSNPNLKNVNHLFDQIFDHSI